MGSWLRLPLQQSSGVVGNAVVTLPSVTLSIAPLAIAVVPGLSHAFTATVTGLANTEVNWTVKGSGGGTITSAGLYTAPSATGIYKVIATASADTNYSAAAVVLVTAKPSPFSPTGNLVHGRAVSHRDIAGRRDSAGRWGR